MTTEASYFVRIAPALQATVCELSERTKITLRRSSKLPAGDRTEAHRFEELHAAIDQCALASIWGGEPYVLTSTETTADSKNLDLEGSTVFATDGGGNPLHAPAEVLDWLDEGAVVVELHLPHQKGETPLTGTEGKGPPPPAERWQSIADQPREAIRDRFHHLISKALSAEGSFEGVIRPSDINNSVLTETLREHVDAGPGMSRVELPVCYRDGSYGPPFPLHALSLGSEVPEGCRVLRFTLLSIRHVEMDTLVDGAWFRNAKISLPREAGLTDQIAFNTSIQQLRALLPHGPTIIHMYQTGLDTAVMGFYRAITYHLLEHPKSVSVVPYYFRGRGQFTEGTPWTMA